MSILSKHKPRTENAKASDSIARWWAATLTIAIIFGMATSYFITQAKSHAEDKARAKLVGCIQKWAKDTTVRAGLIRLRSNARVAALDDLIAATQTPNATAFRDALNRYEAATAAFNLTDLLHPIPNAPSLDCNLTPGRSTPMTSSTTHQSVKKPGVATHPASPSVVIRLSIVPVPTPGPTRTITATGPGATSTRYLPGSTVTKQVPGSRVTVTRTRIVPGPTKTICLDPLGRVCI